MICKFTLSFDGKEYELDSDCISNWDNIKCTFERKNYSGIIRTFSSEFEFVNDAYVMLKNVFLKNGVSSNVIISIYTINDRWTYDKVFECPLDFSSISWDAYILKISCIDNSLSSLIKANGNTKFEFDIGTDIPINNKLNYDRVKMINSSYHQITGDGVDDRGNTLIGSASSMTRLATYMVGESETYENSPIVITDESNESGSCIAEIVKNTEYIEFDIEIISNTTGSFSNIENLSIYIMEFDKNDNSYNSNYKNLGLIFQTSKTSIHERTFIGAFSSYEALLSAYPNPPSDVWAAIGNSRKEASEVYYTPISNDSSKVKWEKGALCHYGSRSNWQTYCYTRKQLTTIKILNPAIGKKYGLFYMASLTSSSPMRTPYTYIISSISTKWESRANSYSIDVLSPISVLNALLKKISDKQLNVIPYIDNTDSRIINTYLIPAECIRKIKEAKLYTTFNDFCEWIETVFGYTYYLGERKKSRFKALVEYDWFSNGVLPEYENDYCPDANKSDITFYEQAQLFLIYNSNNGKYYNHWDNSELYNDVNTMTARHDVLYKSLTRVFFINDDGTICNYDDITMWDKDVQNVYFVHRNSLFTATKEIEVGTITDSQYKVNNALLYSRVEVGYEKQDYEKKCGRDEWNFTNYYTTGITASDKLLSLKSKYRADCYGFEFVSQKNNDETTDNESDEDIFFVHCKLINSENEEEDSNETIKTSLLEIYRSVQIEGVLSDTVFNGEYSPLKCLQANLGYVGIMSSNVNLICTATDGNSNVMIDNVPNNSPILSQSPLFSVGELSFGVPKLYKLNENEMIKVRTEDTIYTGFIKKIEYSMAKEETVEYTIIVKSVEYDN